MPETPARDALARAAGALTPARKVGELLDNHRAEVLRGGLIDTERAMLRYALELAEDKKASEPDEFTDDDEAAVESLKRLAVEYAAPEYTESVIYQVVGDWGVDSADSAGEARENVRKSLLLYPKCGAYAQQRIVREWDDGSEFYGPWTPLT